MYDIVYIQNADDDFVSLVFCTYTYIKKKCGMHFPSLGNYFYVIYLPGLSLSQSVPVVSCSYTAYILHIG